MARMTLGEFLDYIEGGQIFGVTFIKKTDGTERTMAARRGVTKGVKGVIPPEVRREEDERNGVLTVFDTNVPGEGTKGAFRRINLEAIISVTVDGKFWKWDNKRKEFKS